jgi:hypothetical protein
MKKKMMICVAVVMGFGNTGYSMDLGTFAQGAGAAWAATGAAMNINHLINILSRGTCDNPSKKEECKEKLKKACAEGLAVKVNCNDALKKQTEGTAEGSGLDASISAFKSCISI